jgi:hypothetical protein
MDAQHVILDLRSCVADREWERAGVYFDDLRAAAEFALVRKPPQVAGAIAATLDGVEMALGRHDGRGADGGLRHLSWLL